MVESQQVREWQAQARAEGRAEGQAEGLLVILEAMFGPVPADLAARVRGTTDLAALTRWTTLAVRAPSLEQFRQDAQV